MATVDQRVVQMQFDNRQFEQGIAQTLASLDKLKKASQLEGAAKGFQDLSNASQKVNLKGLEAGVQSIADRFTAFGRIATGALESIGARAFEAGKTFVNSFTFKPIFDGFREYETNMNSIQTILANTQAAGTTLNDVTHSLDELNHYSDQTIYNFSEMAKNIGTFTAAGVDLKTSTAAIKGIANLAALSGSNSQQASAAMYQLSQALSAGKVSLEDWNSVVNAGMGGTVFQRALAMNAVKMGTLNENALKLTGSMKNVTIEGQSFRQSIEAKPGKESWLTSKVLTQTLAQFTGDLSDAELAAQGFTKAEIMAIQQQAAMAKSAATEVKTLTQLFGTFKEQLGSGWAQTWKIIFGDFLEAKGMFTEVSNTIGGMLQRSSDSRNQMLSDWKELGGRTALIQSISNAFNALLSVLRPIRDAFRQIFPKSTGKDLYGMTLSLQAFTEKLAIGGEAAGRLKRTFAGFFAAISIGMAIVKEIVWVFLRLFGAATEGSGGILKFTAGVGDFIVRVKQGLVDGHKLTDFFMKLGDILLIPIQLLRTIAGRVKDFFGQFDTSGATSAVADFGTKLSPLKRAIDAFLTGGDKLNSFLANLDVGKYFEPFLNGVRNFFSNFGNYIANFMGGVDWRTVFAGINTGALVALVVAIGKALSGIGGPGGFLETASDSIESMTDTLGAMQNTLRAATLLQIAAAVGILAVSANTLSKINAEDLKKALKAMTGMLVQLLGAMLIFDKLSGVTSFIRMGLSLILLATAINILTDAVKALSEIEWDALVRGLKGTAALLAAVAVAARLMSGVTGLVSTGAGLLILAAALKVLVTVVQDLSEMEWEKLKKGLIGVGSLLASLALFTRLAAADKGGFSQGLGILLLAAGIKVLASALDDFAQMSWGEIGKGLATLAGALVAIGAALRLIPPTAVFSAAGVLLVATSLNMIGDAVEDMAKLSWKEVVKGVGAIAGALMGIAIALKLMPPQSLLSAAAILVVATSLNMIGDALEEMAQMSLGELTASLVGLAAALTIISLGVNSMVGALPGAAAMVIIAGALLLINQSLMTYAAMSWEEMGQSLLMLAGVFVVLGGTAIILAPLAPVLLAVGAAITLLGIGVLAAGAGVMLFATGLTALAVAGTAATAAFIALISGLIALLPMVLTQLGLAIVAFANVIATAGPAFFKAMTTVLSALLDAIKVLTPKILDTLLSMLLALLQKLNAYVPKLVEAGSNLVIGVLNGFAQKMPEIVTAGVNLVVKFLEGIAQNMAKIIQAAIDLIVAFVNGLATGIRNNSAALGEAGANLGTAIIEGIVRALGAGLQTVINKAKEIGKGAINAAKGMLGISSPSKEFKKIGEYSIAGLVIGLEKSSSLVEKSSAGVANSALTGAQKTLSKFSDILSSDLDTTHVITPVLDLTHFKKNVGYIRDVLSSRSLSVDSTYSAATSASTGYRNNQTAVLEDSQMGLGGTSLTFNQYNNSPKSLSSADIYRQTRSQLSVVKEVLPK